MKRERNDLAGSRASSERAQPSAPAAAAAAPARPRARHFPSRGSSDPHITTRLHSHYTFHHCSPLWSRSPPSLHPVLRTSSSYRPAPRFSCTSRARAHRAAATRARCSPNAGILAWDEAHLLPAASADGGVANSYRSLPHLYGTTFLSSNIAHRGPGCSLPADSKCDTAPY